MDRVNPPDGQLDRRAVVRSLLTDRANLLVITGLGSPSYDAFAAADHDANFYLWGAMGGAALTGLGLALAQPDCPVAVITGDGEQLMGLGGLATIAVQQPRNLSIVVLDNGHFGETGMQKSHAGLGVDLDKVAASMGFTAIEVGSMDQLDSVRADLHRIDAAVRFFRVRIRAEETPRALPARDGVHLKNRFRGHLGFPVT
jgi:thiamine pyrophosphate-dependent acetolactate synthase large subunit-like protein